MTHIKSETAYKAAMDRIEELLPMVQEDTPPYDRNLIELDLELLGVSTSRVSDYLNGRCEPTLQVAREISRKLNIDADIVLGV